MTSGVRLQPELHRRLRRFQPTRKLQRAHLLEGAHSGQPAWKVVLSGKLSNPETARQLATLAVSGPGHPPIPRADPKPMRRRKALTEEEVRRATAEYATGRTVKQLASTFDVHHTVISDTLREAGVRLRQTRLSATEVEAARSLRAAGWTFARIADHHNCGIETVRRRLRSFEPEG